MGYFSVKEAAAAWERGAVEPEESTAGSGELSSHQPKSEAQPSPIPRDFSAQSIIDVFERLSDLPSVANIEVEGEGEEAAGEEAAEEWVVEQEESSAGSGELSSYQPISEAQPSPIPRDTSAQSIIDVFERLSDSPSVANTEAGGEWEEAAAEEAAEEEIIEEEVVEDVTSEIAAYHIGDEKGASPRDSARSTRWGSLSGAAAGEAKEPEEAQLRLRRVGRSVNSDGTVWERAMAPGPGAVLTPAMQNRAASDTAVEVSVNAARRIEHGKDPEIELMVNVAPDGSQHGAKASRTIAVLGAETFLGTYITQAILRSGERKVKALVCSEDRERSKFLAYLCVKHGGHLQIEDIGPLVLSVSQIHLRGALRGVDVIVNCAELFSRDQPGRAVDQALASVRNLSRAISASGSSVTRLVHSGSDLAIWNPTTGDAEAKNVDESCWFSFTGASEPKYSHPEAYAVTAAEMYLWSEAADAPYSMVVVNSSVLLGPGLSSFHAAEPGMQLIMHILSNSSPPCVLSPCVDVRDVASLISNLCTSHVEVCGRIIASSEVLTTDGLAAKLRGICANGHIRSRPGRRLLGRRWWRSTPTEVLIPYMMSKEGVKERTCKARLYEVSSQRATGEVNARFRPLEETVRDSVEFLHSSGFIDMHRKSNRAGRSRQSAAWASLRRTSRLSFQGRDDPNLRRSKLRSSSMS